MDAWMDVQHPGSDFIPGAIIAVFSIIWLDLENSGKKLLLVQGKTTLLHNERT